MEESKQIAEFNESALQIQRLHNHWLEISRYRELGLLQKVRWKLDSVELELSNDSTEQSDDKKDYVKELNDINNKIDEIDEIIIKIKKIDNKLSDEDLNSLRNSLLYKHIKEKERLLREIQQKSGKGARYKDLEGDDFD